MDHHRQHRSSPATASATPAICWTSTRASTAHTTRSRRGEPTLSRQQQVCRHGLLTRFIPCGEPVLTTGRRFRLDRVAPQQDEEAVRHSTANLPARSSPSPLLPPPLGGRQPAPANPPATTPCPVLTTPPSSFFDVVWLTDQDRNSGVQKGRLRKPDNARAHLECIKYKRPVGAVKRVIVLKAMG